jgi:hypothetical protein
MTAWNKRKGPVTLHNDNDNLYTRADWSKIYRYRPTKKMARVSEYKIVIVKR